MIREITSGSVVVEYGPMTLTIDVEMLVGGKGRPDFVLYSDSIRHWDPPNENVPLDKELKEIILRTVLAEMHDAGHVVEVDDLSLDAHFEHMEKLRARIRRGTIAEGSGALPKKWWQFWR